MTSWKKGRIVIALLLMPATALATQTHSDPEGLYVHQLSHLFFVFSMGILIYWLRARGLVRKTGWRYIQYAAVFFILWTLDAFTAHLLDEQLTLVHVSRPDAWHIRIDAPAPLAVLYYLVKLDHLFSVPGLVFLYLGLTRLADTPDTDSMDEAVP